MQEPDAERGFIHNNDPHAVHCSAYDASTY